MIYKQMSLSVAKCLECDKILVYVQAEGIPGVCPHCGVPKNIELTTEQRKQMERMHQRQGQQVHTIRF